MSLISTLINESEIPLSYPVDQIELRQYKFPQLHSLDGCDLTKSICIFKS